MLPTFFIPARFMNACEPLLVELQLLLVVSLGLVQGLLGFRNPLLLPLRFSAQGFNLGLRLGQEGYAVKRYRSYFSNVYNTRIQISERVIQEAKESGQVPKYVLWIDGDKQERRTDANTIQNLLPLMMGDLPAEHVDMIVAQLQDETKFNLPFGLPTVAKNDPQFCADFPVDLMWRGPVWPFMNWMVTEGLILHGRQDVAQALLDKTIALYQKSGVWEHYNPITGAAYGAVGLGMSTLIVDMLYRLGRV
jgi:hypothetical protein